MSAGLPDERHAVTPADVAGYEPADFQVPEQTAALIREAVPENTALAYRSRWRSFEAWCRDAGRVALPATAQTVAAYLTHLVVDRGLKATTADAHLTAVRAVHRGAGATVPDALAARKVVTAAAKREAARDGRYGPRKAVPLLAADLPAITATCDLETAAGLRDRAVILLGFALLARRAELAALNVSDVEHVPGEGLAVTFRASKTDQSARGVTRRIHYGSDGALCPVRAVLAWLEYLAARGHTSGPLFTRVDRWGNLGAAAGGRYRTATPASRRQGGTDPVRNAGRGQRVPAARDGRLRPQAIGDIVVAACEAAGLAAPGTQAGPARPQGIRQAMPPGRPGGLPSAGRRRYSGHSLRRGGATSMLKAGAQPLNVSRHGRWADGSRAFAGYVEEATGFGDANPTKNLLLALQPCFPACSSGPRANPAGRPVRTIPVTFGLCEYRIGILSRTGQIIWFWNCIEHLLTYTKPKQSDCRPSDAVQSHRIPEPTDIRWNRRKPREPPVTVVPGAMPLRPSFPLAPERSPATAALPATAPGGAGVARGRGLPRFGQEPARFAAVRPPKTR